MQPNNFLELLKKHKECSLYHRYINNDHIESLLNNLGHILQLSMNLMYSTHRFFYPFDPISYPCSLLLILYFLLNEWTLRESDYVEQKTITDYTDDAD